jgi:hypothetical protein
VVVGWVGFANVDRLRARKSYLLSTLEASVLQHSSAIGAQSGWSVLQHSSAIGAQSGWIGVVVGWVGFTHSCERIRRRHPLQEATIASPVVDGRREEMWVVSNAMLWHDIQRDGGKR